MLVNLQALRALAAIGVVVFHVGTIPGTKMPFTVGAAGVDVFFVLSGFIIPYSASRDARAFLPRRLLRIIPAYWIATIVAALFTLESMSLRDCWDWLVQSLFYLPEARGRPVLIFVAWTLVYELAFYALYWLALRGGVRRAPFAALAALPVLALVPIAALPRTWPLFLEFAIGVGIYVSVERFDLCGWIGERAGVAITVSGLLLLPVLPELITHDNEDCQGFGRVLTWGLPAGCIVLGAIIAERHGFTMSNRAIQSLGAASYAIYLMHPVVLGQLLRLSPVPAPFSWATCIAGSALAVVVGAAFHLWIETPLLRVQRRLRSTRAAEAPKHIGGGSDVRLA